MIESVTPEHIQYKTICAIFSWLSVIKCASLIGRLYEEIGLNEYNWFALIHCCCCRDLCTAVLLQRSWCWGFWRQTGLHTSRSPFCDREMACTVCAWRSPSCHSWERTAREQRPEKCLSWPGWHYLVFFCRGQNQDPVYLRWVEPSCWQAQAWPAASYGPWPASWPGTCDC